MRVWKFLVISVWLAAPAIAFANFNHYFHSVGKMGVGYFVRVGTTNGNLGGLSGADSWCLTQLNAGSWLGKAEAQNRGLLVGPKVRAFLCTSTTCNNLRPHSTYAFATTASAVSGGTVFTTDASGRGPNDNADWSGATYFGTATGVWTGARDTVTTAQWSTTPSAGPSCNDWVDATISYTAQKGGTAQTTDQRWNLSSTDTCNSTNRVICIVDP